MTAGSDDNNGETWAAFALSIFALVLVGVLADTLNWETNTASSAAGAATMAPNGIALYRRRRRTGIGEEFTAMTHGDLARPPLLVVGVLASALLIVDSILGGVIGAIVNTTIGMTNGDADEFMTAYSVVSLFVALPLTLLATYLLAKHAAHFLSNRIVLWLAAAIALYVAMRLAVITISSSALSAAGFEISFAVLVAGFAVVAPAMFLACWLGKHRAAATHPQFVAMRLFRRLEADDRQAALELLGESAVNLAHTPKTAVQAGTLPA